VEERKTFNKMLRYHTTGYRDRGDQELGDQTARREPMKKHISSGNGPPWFVVIEESFMYVSCNSQK
jgi:hypothetical protein